MYSKKVMSHFKKPHNMGKIAKPDGTGKVGNIVCGDVMWLYIKVVMNKEKKEVITDAKFETFGCVAAIATSSAITDLAIGKTLEQALAINKQQVIDSLGSLPSVKIHCSVLASDALTEAIYDYLVQRKRQIPEELEVKHIRLLKEKEMVEEKYKDWVCAEEQSHD